MTEQEAKDDLPDFKGVEILNILGEGSYGAVYEVNYEGKERALKVYKGNVPDIIEIDTLSRIHHPNIIPVLKVLNGKDFGIIMPLGDTTLRTYLQTPRSLDTRINILYKIVNAVDFLLEQNILPFDLHSGNVVMMGDEPLIIDTGLARRVDCRGSIVISPHFLMRVDLIPPENSQGSNEYSEASIVWGLGILAYSILTSGKVPRYSREDAKQMGILNMDDTFTRWIDHYIRNSTSVKNLFQTQVPDAGNKIRIITDLAMGMLERNLEGRFTMKDILQHPLFSEQKSYPMGTVVSSDFTLYPEMEEDVKVLVKAMLDDVIYTETHYMYIHPPSSIIFGALYVYQRFISVYGKDSKYRIAVPLQVMYNLYGGRVGDLIPSVFWEGKQLTHIDSYVREIVTLMEGIVHPITDYDKALTKLIGGETTLVTNDCPKPNFNEVAMGILGSMYYLHNEAPLEPLYFAVISYDAKGSLEDARSLQDEDLSSRKVGYYVLNNMYSQLGQTIQSLLGWTFVTEPEKEGYLYYQDDLRRAEDYVSDLLYVGLRNHPDIERIGDPWKVDGTITIINMY